MPGGRQSKRLGPEQIRRLSDYRMLHRLSLPQLNRAMAAPFRWGVLHKALLGKPIWDLNHKFIVEWLDVHCLGKPAAIDGKAAASGEREEAPAAGEFVSRGRD
jgi:hypothetical protein